MPKTTIVFYRDDKGIPLVLSWLRSLPKDVRAKGIIRLHRLGDLGYEIRRLEADLLRDGVYELRWSIQHVNYRILYFYYGKAVVVLTNGITKEKKVPEQAIAVALKRKQEFEKSPDLHWYEENPEE